MKQSTIVLTDVAATLNAAGTVIGTTTAGISSGFASISVFAELQGVTGGTLDVYIQTLVQNNAPGAVGTWYDWAHFAQLAGGAALTTVASHQTKETINPSVMTAVGKNGAPILAVNTFVGGAWGEAMRLVYIVGAGASVGSVQKVTLIGWSDGP